MSEMEYGNVDLEILVNEEYLGHEYLILNLYGSHPTAYVRLKDNEILSHYDDYEIEVHGGLTFLGTPLTREDGTWLGWDYGHYCDYIYYNVGALLNKVLEDLYKDLNLSEKKKWTTEEIQEEVKSVIEQLIKLLNKEERK
jgi:hypothetical protein